MSDLSLEAAPSATLVSPPEARESYWQPVPANGHIDVALAPHIVGMEFPFAMGTQTVAPGGYVREHSHPDNEEALYILEGKGRAAARAALDLVEGRPARVPRLSAELEIRASTAPPPRRP